MQDWFKGVPDWYTTFNMTSTGNWIMLFRIYLKEGGITLQNMKRELLNWEKIGLNAATEAKKRAFYKFKSKNKHLFQ